MYFIVYNEILSSMTANPGVASFIQAQSHTFLEIHLEIFSTTILLTSADSGRAVVSSSEKYNEVLVNHLVKLAQENNVVR